MRIALCDDEAPALQTLHTLVQTFCQQQNIPASIERFSSGEALLDSPGNYDILFMDIYLTGINGVETVTRMCDPSHQQIVFTTTSRDYAVEAFYLNAAHYLVKPLTQQSVTEAMERCLLRLKQSPKSQLSLKTNHGILSVPMEQITYIEVFNKVCTIHTIQNEFQSYSSLEALFALLDPNSFLRVQRSFVVNMRFIESFFFDHVIMRDGTEITLSRSSRADLKKQYQQFLARGNNV